MSIGGHSLHGKDYAMLAGLAGLGATGLGAAGMGPLAGLLGPSAAAVLGPGAAAEVGAEAAGLAGTGAGIGYGGSAATVGKTLQSLARAQQLMALVNPPRNGAGAMPQKRQQQGPQYSDAMKLFEQIYGGSA